MNGRALCTTLSLLLAAAQRRASDFEYEVHEVIHRLIDLAQWSDERKADLYALLAESVRADDRLIEIERKVERALRANDARFPHG